MKRPRSGWRIGAVLLFLLGLLMSFGAPGVGAQSGFTCDDFNNPLAAQMLLDADPDLADALDPDGNGLACDDGETVAYLADLQDELDTLWVGIDRFFEIPLDIDDATTEADRSDLREESLALAQSWTEYPDVAAGLAAPEGLDDIEDAYLLAADTLAEAGAMWLEFSAEPEVSDQDTIDGFIAFSETFYTAQEQLLAVQDMLDEVASGETIDHPSTAEIGAYVDAVRAHNNELILSCNEMLNYLDESGALDTHVDEIVAILDLWEAAPERASALDVPAGFGEIDDAYTELVDAFQASYVAFVAFLEADKDSPEAVDALAAFEDAMTHAIEMTTVVQQAIANAGQ